MFNDALSAVDIQLGFAIFLILSMSGLGWILFRLGQRFLSERQNPSQELPKPTDAIAANANPNEREILELRQECLNLQEQLRSQSLQLISESRAQTFQELQSLLTQYKSVQKMVEAKPDLPAKNLTAMFAPLDNLIAAWEYEPIGSVWLQVSYDPQIHQADRPEIRAGDLVYIRFIGYRDNRGRILVPAKVSRTLPSKS